MNIKRKLQIIENNIKRCIQSNEESFETFNLEILDKIETKTVRKLEDIIDSQANNIEKYSIANRYLRTRLKIIDALKKYTNGDKNE